MGAEPIPSSPVPTPRRWLARVRGRYCAGRGRSRIGAPGYEPFARLDLPEYGRWAVYATPGFLSLIRGCPVIGPESKGLVGERTGVRRIAWPPIGRGPALASGAPLIYSSVQPMRWDLRAVR